MDQGWSAYCLLPIAYVLLLPFAQVCLRAAPSFDMLKAFYAHTNGRTMIPQANLEPQALWIKVRNLNSPAHQIRAALMYL